jgi:salicylate hydroxylase
VRPGEPVLVVGAGIAGLTTALALGRHGFAVEVFERAERLEEIGAGIQISPNALRVLDRLGLLGALRECGVEAETVSLRDLRSGRQLASVPVRGRDGTPYLSVLRSDLQHVLLAAVRETPAIRLNLGAELVAARRKGQETVLHFSGPSGREAGGRTVIAADGVRSKLADAFGHAVPAPSGDAAWRLTIEADGESPGGIVAWLGPSRHVVAYPVDRRRRVNVVVVVPAGVDRPRTALVGSDGLPGRVAEAFGAATAWPLATCDRRRRPGDPEGLLLIGDAAHAMLPYAAQGAALAVEDGFVAATCLAQSADAASAWRRFEALRRPRWEKVQRRVAFHRLVYHLPQPLAAARNAVLRRRSEASLARDLAWLYDWEPPER